MKMKMIVAVLVLGMSSLSFAQQGSGDRAGGGGDPQETRFKEIATDIVSWIQKKGYAGLRLPANLSAEDYKAKMLQVLTQNFIVTMKGQVRVGLADKVCRNDYVKSKLVITCDADRFSKQKEADQYMLVHHEFAGAAGVERNVGEVSDYEVSKQITSYLTQTTQLKLAVKPKSVKLTNPIANMCYKLQKMGRNREASTCLVFYRNRGDVYEFRAFRACEKMAYEANLNFLWKDCMHLTANMKFSEVDYTMVESFLESGDYRYANQTFAKSGRPRK